MSTTPPRLAPTPPDLFGIELAALSGASSHQAGLALSSNPYRYETLREMRLTAWAFELGWRESEWIAKRAREGRAA